MFFCTIAFAQQSDSLAITLPQDSLKTPLALDSLSLLTAKQDSLNKIPRDSSARIEQFLYQRKDSPTTSVSSFKNSFFLSTPAIIQREVKLDSTGKYVTIRETLYGKDIKIPITMPLSEYIAQRSQFELQKNFQELITKDDAGKQNDAVNDLFSSFTKIDIPIPANPVFSIFGPPRINIQIGGSVDIHAGFRNTTTDQNTLSILGNSRNEPDFSQQVQVTVTGTIGDKLSINADWNTQRTFEYENQLKIKYTGYEDEIIQSIEAGNVSLSTNSAFIGSSSALFGVKAVTQFGPLKLTSVASQKKGQVQGKTISGGSQTKEFSIQLTKYSTDHFLIDTSYRPYYEQQLQKQTTNGNVQVIDYEVWTSRIGTPDPNKDRKGVAILNLPPNTSQNATQYNAFRQTKESVAGEVEVLTWEKLERGKDYTLHDFTGHLILEKSVSDGQAIAISYKVADGNTYGEFDINSSDTSQVLVFKLIKPKNLLPQYKAPWNMMLKNIYSLGGKNIKKDGFELEIKYTLPGQEPVTEIAGQKILRVVGLDRVSDDGSPTPDNKFDYIRGTTIDEARGEIIFPSLEPFKTGMSNYFKENNIAGDTLFTYPEIYDTTLHVAEKSVYNRYTITGKTTAENSNTISLGFNVVEGSVKVLLNGIERVEGSDYTVDYIVGQIIIRNPELLASGQKLEVKYEQNDLFQLASKTLLGTRGEMQFSEKTFLGFTIMNLNQETLSDKVRLGEEPINNSIYGIDFNTSTELPFLTKALDALPFISTKAKSDFSIKGEVAYMSPDPNTKKSSISGDGGESVAYLDDFEGAKRTISFGTTYTSWKDMSPPKFQYGVDPDILNLIPDSTKIYSKGKTFWYTLERNVSVTDIWPNRSISRGNDAISAFNIYYNPLKRGEYNYSPDLQQTLLTNPKKNWGGIQKLLSSSKIDLGKENITFIELWVKIEQGTIDSTRKVFLDLGGVSEDVIPVSADKTYGKLDTEEKNLPNNILNEGEDTGIDGIFDADEKIRYADFIQANKSLFPEIENDPAGDNWSKDASFESINNGENSQLSESGQNPNTEDLNGNNVLDKVDNYFEYELNLDTSATNPQRVGGGVNGWYQYRIPIVNYKRKVGSPDFSLIEFARLWFTGFDTPLHLKIVEFNLVGNQWEELKKNDSTFAVSVVNVEDNLSYSSPPGVVRERDKTKPDEQVYANEQSLVLTFNNLQDGENREAIKRFSKAMDIFSYKEMKMFVHGSPHFSSTAATPDAKVFIRFGVDSTNYYEYRTSVFPGWDARNNISINFENITALKQGRDSAAIVSVITKPVEGGPDGATYGVRGNPALTNITYISIGVENPNIPNTTTNLTGEIWVNELRLTNVDDAAGWAYNVSATLHLADISTVNFTYSQKDPNFHGLEERFGSRSTNENWTVATSVGIEKLLPSTWSGTSLPISYSHSENFSQPKYLPSSDVLVTEASERQREVVLTKTNSSTEAEKEAQRIITETQTKDITDTYTMSNIKINIPSERWYIRDIINRFSYGTSYTTKFSRSPTVAKNNYWKWDGSINYGYTLSPDLYIAPFGFLSEIFFLKEFKDLKIFFPITGFSFGTSASRSRTEELKRNLQKVDLTRGFTASRGFNFDWKLTENGFINPSGDYKLSISSSLLHLETDRFNQQRSFSSIMNDIFFKSQVIYFGNDNNYQQIFNLNTKPRFLSIGGIDKFLTLSFRYGVTYTWNNSYQNGDLGKSTNWNNNISTSMDFSLKQFVETWWSAKQESKTVGMSRSDGTPQPTQQTPRGRGRERREEDVSETPKEENENIVKPLQDSIAIVSEIKDSTSQIPSTKNKIVEALRILIKTPLLDYDKITLSFTQGNNSQNPGVPGRPGFGNFFGRVPFFQEQDADYGPTRMYQLGLSSTPTVNGLRAANANISDVFGQKNTVSIKTNRELWTGARLDLNWDLSWEYSRTQTIRTDEKGTPTITNTATGGRIDRSFFTIPPVFIFSIFKSGIEEVGKQYSTLRSNKGDTRNDALKLAEAFETGFETLPIFKKLLGSYYPHVNYSFQWDGLEKISFFEKFASRISFNHSYKSGYSQTFKGTVDGNTIENQHIDYAFSPLIGFSITFKELLKGNASANIKFNTNANYDLTPSTKNISEGGTQEISVTGSYARSGFEFPFFGISLKNDIDMSFSYSFSKNSKRTYSFGEEINLNGTPGEGSSKTIMEPRIKYTLSARVTASLFYRYTKTAPDEGGSRIPGSSINEGGVDVKIMIQ